MGRKLDTPTKALRPKKPKSSGTGGSRSPTQHTAPGALRRAPPGPQTAPGALPGAPPAAPARRAPKTRRPRGRAGGRLEWAATSRRAGVSGGWALDVQTAHRERGMSSQSFRAITNFWGTHPRILGKITFFSCGYVEGSATASLVEFGAWLGI